MRRCRTMPRLPAAVLVSLCLALPAAVLGQGQGNAQGQGIAAGQDGGQPKSGGDAGADPSAGAPKTLRGSFEENAQFQDHLLPSQKGPKAKKKAPAAASGPDAPPGGEVSQTLAPNDRPSKRLLKAKRKEKAPKHQNKLENTRARDPNELAVEYDLDEDADVSVTVVGPDGLPVQQVSIPAGGAGGRKGKNKTVLWDGRDFHGREAPAGQYFMFQSIKYQKAPKGKGKRETKMLPVRKRDK